MSKFILISGYNDIVIEANGLNLEIFTVVVKLFPLRGAAVFLRQAIRASVSGRKQGSLCIRTGFSGHCAPWYNAN